MKRISVIFIFLFCAGLSIAIFIFLSFKNDAIQNISKDEVQKASPIPKENKVNEIIGFLPYWNLSGDYEVLPQNFTKIIYFGLAVDKNGDILKRGPEWQMFNSKKFSSIKNDAQKSGTKIILALTNFDNASINYLIQNTSATENFIYQTESLIKENELDGINFDFEYQQGTSVPSSSALSDFFKKVNSRLRIYYPSFSLSFDVSGRITEKKDFYDVRTLGDVFDFIILMGYDYRTAKSVWAGPAAPIDGEVNDHTIRESVEYFVNKVPFEKLVLGIPLYGYEWETLDARPKSSVVGKKGAVATYKRILKLLSENASISSSWDEKARSPWFSYKENNVLKQVYYEDKKSIGEKINFVKETKLGGVAFWALGYEGNNSDIFNTLR